MKSITILILILFVSPIVLAGEYAEFGVGLYEIGDYPEVRLGSLEVKYGKEFAWGWNIEAGLIKGIVDNTLRGCVYELNYGYGVGINRESSRLVYGANYTKLEGKADCKAASTSTFQESQSGVGYGLGFRFGEKDSGVKLMFETVMDDVRRITLIKKISL